MKLIILNPTFINLLYKRIIFKKLFLQIDYKEILAIINISKNFTITPPSLYQPQFNLPSKEIHLIQYIIKTPNYQNYLTQLYNNILNLNTTNLQFYTDAFIKNLKTSNIQTGIGWICENDFSINFSAAIPPSPDSTRSELIATIPLLLTLPFNSTLTFYMDNLSAIKGLSSFTSHKLIQQKNWDIISIINLLLTTKNISINLIKVKSHSTSSLHNQADLLAKHGTAKPIIEIFYLYFNFPTHFL